MSLITKITNRRFFKKYGHPQRGITYDLKINLIDGTSYLISGGITERTALERAKRYLKSKSFIKFGQTFSANFPEEKYNGLHVIPRSSILEIVIFEARKQKS